MKDKQLRERVDGISAIVYELKAEVPHIRGVQNSDKGERAAHLSRIKECEKEIMWIKDQMRNGVEGRDNAYDKFHSDIANPQAKTQNMQARNAILEQTVKALEAKVKTREEQAGYHEDAWHRTNCDLIRLMDHLGLEFKETGRVVKEK